jgi:mono/diheme cytochrome c family protein
MRAPTALLLFLLASACGPDAPSGPAGGAELYRQQGCATCHGAAGEGAITGPDIRGAAARWGRDDLAAFLADPEAFVAKDPRLAQQKKKYMMPMQSFGNLPPEQRLAIADHVLSLR